MARNPFDNASAASQANMTRDVQRMVKAECGNDINYDRAQKLARRLLAGRKSTESLYHVATSRLKRMCPR